MKKVLSMLLALAMVLTMAAFPAFAEEGTAVKLSPSNVTSINEAENTDNTVWKIFDGKYGTTWGQYFKTKDSVSTTAKGEGQFVIEMDFDRGYNFTELAIAGLSCYTTGFALYGRNNVTDEWVELGDFAPAGRAKETFAISHTGNYRYLKFEGYKFSYNGQVGIEELEIYGVAGGETVIIDNANVTATVNGAVAAAITDGVNALEATSWAVYNYPGDYSMGDGTSEIFSIYFDLGAEYDLHQLFIRGGEVRPTMMNLYVSNDNETWGDPVATITPTYATETTWWSRYATVTLGNLGGEYRYVKLEATKLSMDYTEGKKPAIHEIIFYEWVENEPEEKVPATYTVKYESDDPNFVAPADKVVEGKYVGDTVTEEAVAVDGYKPTETSKEVTLEAGENTITFTYVSVKDIAVDFEAVPEITPIESAVSTIGAAQKPVENIFDGNDTTGYIAGWKTANSVNPLTGCSITLTLDNYYDLSQINVLWGGSFGWWSEGTMTAGSIEVSTDGVEFVPVDTYTDLPAGESNGDNGFVREDAIMFPAVAKNVKYVRINVTKMSASYLAVREITFNGVEHLDDVYQTETTYTVNYVDEEGNPVADADANVASYAGNIALATAKEIEGYRASTDAAAYILGSDAAENVINFVYTKKVVTSYTVNYVDEEGNPVADSKVVESAYAGDSYVEKPIKLIDKGYLYVSTEVDTSVVPVEDAASNVVTYTYKKIIPAVSATGKNNSTATGGGTSGDALYNGMIIGSQAQYIVDKAYDFSSPVVEYVLGYAQPYDFSKIYVYTNASKASQVNFYVSNDGENWGEPVLSTSVADTNLTYTYANGASASVYVSEYTLPEGSAGRYLKYEVVVATVSEAQATWCHVYEIAAVGTKTDLTARPELAGVSEGAQIRLPAGTVTAGIRFGATIVKDVFGDALTTGDYSYAELAAKGIKVGMFILPQNLLGGHATLADYVIANDGAGQARDVAAQNIYAEDDVAVTFTAVLTGIPDTEYNREIVAVPYVYIDGEYTFYAEMTRTYAAVAADVAEAYEGGEIDLTEEQITLIQAVIGRDLVVAE